MDNIYPLNSDISMEDKWSTVRNYYEKTYDVKFKEKLSTNDIQVLFVKISKLQSEISNHFEKKPGAYQKFLQNKDKKI